MEGKREETATEQDKEREEKGWVRRREGEKETEGKGDKSVEREKGEDGWGRGGQREKKLHELECRRRDERRDTVYCKVDNYSL